MRGKVLAWKRLLLKIGITPAYAGKSKQPFLDFLSVGDHPRLCGEKYLYESEHCLPRGSPPPMRGKGASWKCLLDCKGITPAYAGKRFTRSNSVYISEDHPRLCGEKLDIAEAVQEDKGSPPPMRGKVPRSSVIFDCVRITPAYAGKRF